MSIVADRLPVVSRVRTAVTVAENVATWLESFIERLLGFLTQIILPISTLAQFLAISKPVAKPR